MAGKQKQARKVRHEGGGSRGSVAGPRGTRVRKPASKRDVAQSSRPGRALGHDGTPTETSIQWGEKHSPRNPCPGQLVRQADPGRACHRAIARAGSPRAGRDGPPGTCAGLGPENCTSRDASAPGRWHCRTRCCTVDHGAGPGAAGRGWRPAAAGRRCAQPGRRHSDCSPVGDAPGRHPSRARRAHLAQQRQANSGL